MKEVFISYSSADLAQADTLRSVLEKNELSCWMAPRDIPGGSNYTKEIPIAIRNCKVFVLVLSQNAQSSQWVLKELDSAVNCGKVILPFMLEDCNLNDEFNFLLTGAQRYSAYQKKAEAMQTLISRIRGIIDAPSAAENEQPQSALAPDAVEEPKPAPKKPAAKPVIDYFGEAKCPACGGTDLKELKGKVTCEGAKEHLAKLWIPALAAAGLIVGFILASLLLSYDLFALTPVFILVGAVLGGIWGNHIFRNTVKRGRLRSGFASTCYRCNRCNKVFDYKEPLDN